MEPTITITGRFPPPIDGQTIATERLFRLLASDLDVHRMDLSPGDTHFAKSKVLFRPPRAWHYLKQLPQLRGQLNELPDTTVLWTSISPALLGHLRDRATVVPSFSSSQTVYAVIHWGNFDRLFTSRLTRLSARRLVDYIDGFVFLTEELSSRCADWIPPAKRHVIPNTIDDDVICDESEVELKQEERSSRGALRLLFISNMTPSKGYMDVLKATRLLLQQGVEVYADFVGRWETASDRSDFQETVEGYRLESQVTHHEGVYDREKIKALYLQADLFVLPTYYPTEAQPLTVIEALNSGTPVITTRHAGIPEMVDAGTEARFVPAQEPERIVQAARRLKSIDRWLAYSRAARERFKRQFSPAVVRERWLDLLDTSDVPSRPSPAEERQ